MPYAGRVGEEEAAVVGYASLYEKDLRCLRAAFAIVVAAVGMML